MENVQYTESGQISFESNGIYVTIPDTPEAKAKTGVDVWEAAGNTIPAYAPAPATDKLINRVQFKSMLALLGKSTDDVMVAIDAVISDPTQNTIAKVKVTDSDYYARSNELFTILGPSMNLTDEQIDAAWEQAVLI